jgi:4-amino-4-deoxy-L-arabinose transferase-like glycosyltransferase
MRRSALTLAAIVALAAGIRLAYVFTTGHSTGIATAEGDVAHNILAYGRWFVRNERAMLLIEKAQQQRHRLIDPVSIDYARLDSEGSWFPEITHPVGEGVVIAAVWAITGDQRYVEPQVLQALVDSAVVLLVYWIAMQLFRRRRVALLAALLYALYPPIAWQTVTLYDDLWAIDFTIVIVAIYLAMMRSSHRWRWLLVAGAVVGIGSYFRPQVLALAPVLAVATVSMTGWREALRRAVTITAVAIAVITPWTVRNYEDFHSVVLIRSGLWETMVQGLNELPNNFAIEPRAHRTRPDLTAETPEWDAYLKQPFVAAVEQHPLFYLEAAVHRVGLATVLGHDSQWMSRGVGDIVNNRGGILAGASFPYRGGLLAFIVHRPFEALEYALEPLVFVLAMIALALTWRRWRSQNKILLAVLLAVAVPYLAIHIETRFLLPAAFVYFIWISLALDLAIERVKARAAA